MGVVFDASDGKRCKSVLPGDATHVCPELIAKVYADQRSATLSTEDYMHESAGIGVPHVQSSLRDSPPCESDPALKRWARFASSLRDDLAEVGAAEVSQEDFHGKCGPAQTRWWCSGTGTLLDENYGAVPRSSRSDSSMSTASAASRPGGP